MSTRVTQSTGSVKRSICCRSTPPAKAAWCTSAAIRGLERTDLWAAPRPRLPKPKPKGFSRRTGAGFAYLEGPDGAIIEYQGNIPAERFNHVHRYQKDPFCAELWYRQHLNARVNQAPGRPVYTEANCQVAPPERSFPPLQPRGNAPHAGGCRLRRCNGAMAHSAR